MKKKLMIVLPVLLLVLGGAYKFVLAKPKEAEAKPKVHGTVYILEKEFLVNLDDGRFAKLTAALVLAHDDTSTAPAGGHSAATPPEGYGAMSQEAVKQSRPFTLRLPCRRTRMGPWPRTIRSITRTLRIENG